MKWTRTCIGLQTNRYEIYKIAGNFYRVRNKETGEIKDFITQRDAKAWAEGDYAKDVRRYGTIEDRDDWVENGKNYSWFKILYKGELYSLEMADGEVESLIAPSM